MPNSWKNLVDSRDFPLLIKGGPASSDTLNKINERIYSDLLELTSKVRDLDRNQQLISTLVNEQVSGINSIVNYIQSLIPTTSGNVGIADFFALDYIGSGNTAGIDTEFGYATLPVISTHERLAYTDTSGRSWVPDDSRILFLAQSDYTPNVVPGDEFFSSSIEDYKALIPQPDSFFLGGYLSNPSYLFLRIQLPRTLSPNNLSNCVSFTPIPIFQSSLINVYYRTGGGDWKSVDFSYIVGYNSNGNPAQANRLGPAKIYFDPTELTEICLVLYLSGWWGLQDVHVQLVEFASSANLVLDFSAYNLSAINNVVIYGRNPNTLAMYPKNISGSTVSISLSQTQSMSSPVITGVKVWK